MRFCETGFCIKGFSTSLEDKLSRDFRYLNVNIGCRLMGDLHGDSIKSGVFHHLNTLFMRLNFVIVSGRSRTLSEKFKKNLNTKKFI